MAMLHYNLSRQSISKHCKAFLKRRVKLTAKILSLVCILFAYAAHSQAKPLVLSSIKPLTLIAQEVAGKSADVDTLLPVTASPHDYPLKMSDYARLQKADIFLWVGPELEAFLEKPVRNLSREHTIAAYTLPDLNWPVEAHESAQAHSHERDPHLWLDPRNAVVVARALGAKLAQIDPASKAEYSNNVQVFTAKMADFDRNLTARLAPFSGRGFAVYHEGYQHFVSHYGLHQLDYVTFTPEQRPGAKHIQQLRSALAKEGVCLFLEPYNEQQSMRDLAEELKLKTGILDALGSQPGVASYPQLIAVMADSFASCLAK